MPLIFQTPDSDCTARRAALRSAMARIRTGSVALTVSAALTVTTLPAPPAQAQGSIPLVRDAEIEELMRDYSRPIFRAAGIGQSNISIILVRSKDFNAFVADGRRMFINVGALMQAERPNQLIGVMAHEAGHIAGGHLARMREQLAKTNTAAILSMLLGAAAAAAAVATGAGGDIAAGAGRGLLAGGTHVAQRSFLAYRRTEEQAADRAAISYLNATGQSARGMLEVFEMFNDQSMFTSRNIDPYLQSHPMPRDRIATLRSLAAASPYFDRKDPPELQARHDMMRAKLFGFLERPQAVLRRYPPSDTSLPARYARAIATFRTADVRRALREIDGLIARQPQNPYFHELKGQALLESGRPKQAIAPLQRAVSLAPDAALIRIMLGQAMVATNDPGVLDAAIGHLQRGLAVERDSSTGFRQLAIAYGRKGRNGEASLAAARAYFAEGAYKLAKQQAARAKKQLPNGSPGWIQADDIINFKTPKSNRRG